MDKGLPFCALCDEPILPGEPISQSLVDGKEVHHECGFRLLGGANHWLKRCTCCGGTEPPDFPGLTKREAAKAALAAYRSADFLYEIARDLCHENGMPWTDPRTGRTHQPPEKDTEMETSHLIEFTPELRKLLGIRPRKGWIGAWTDRQHPEAPIKNGERIEKVQEDEDGDPNPKGATGIVLGSIYTLQAGYGYFIEWDLRPKVATFAVANKIRKVALQ